MLAGFSYLKSFTQVSRSVLALLLCWCLFAMAGLLALPGSIAPASAQINCPANPILTGINNIVYANADTPDCLRMIGPLNNGLEIVNVLHEPNPRIGVLAVRSGGGFLIPASDVTCTGSGCGGTFSQGARRFQRCNSSGSNSCLINIEYTDNNSQTVSATLAINGPTTTIPAFTITGGAFGTGGTPPPLVSSVSPDRSALAGGTVVTITGISFSGATAVNIGGTPATGVTVNSDTSITATVPPAGTGGTASVEVTTPAGTSPANTLFTYDGTAPTVTITGVPAVTDGATPFTATFTFNEDVNDFDLTDIQAALVNANASAFATTTANRVFTATITPTGGGDVTVGVNAAAAQDLAGNDNTAATAQTATQDVTPPTVQILDAPATTDGTTPFQVRFEFSENVVNFDAVGDITLANATASNFVAVDGDTYTATITPNGPADITIDVAAGVAQDAAGNLSLAAAQVVVRSTVVEDTQRVIANFMGNRATHMLSNQPDIGGFIDGTANNGGGPLGDLALNGNEDGLTLAFSSSLSRVRNEIDRRLMLALAPEADQRVAAAHAGEKPAQSGSYAMALGNDANAPESDDTYGADAGPFHAGDARQRRFDVWTAIHGANANAGSSDSSFWVGYFGAHYFVSPDLLVGALAQVDWAEETDGAANSSADGLGWMIGPYVAARLGGQNLFMEARAAWGRSQNDVSPLGTYTDEFETSRWLARGRIYGRYNFGEVTVEPSLAVTYFEETQESYTDSLANTIPEQTISQGELRFGPSFERMMALGDGAYLTPKFGVTGVYNFGIRNGAATQGFVLGDEVLRARVDGGLAFVNALGWSLLLEAYFDGIGADDYDAWGGKAKLTIPVH